MADRLSAKRRGQIGCLSAEREREKKRETEQLSINERGRSVICQWEKPDRLSAIREGDGEGERGRSVVRQLNVRWGGYARSWKLPVRATTSPWVSEAGVDEGIDRCQRCVDSYDHKPRRHHLMPAMEKEIAAEAAG